MFRISFHKIPQLIEAFIKLIFFEFYNILKNNLKSKEIQIL